MKLQMTAASKAIFAMLIVAALAVAFWVLALGPKRDEAKKLGGQISGLKSSLATHHAEVTEAEDAREEFPVNYQQLVVLGKAVPGDDDLASLLVQLNAIAARSKVRFSDFTLSASGGGSAPLPAPAPQGSGATPASSPVSPTEAAASLMPLGATVGPAGLAVMPYELAFSGSFFKLADFIKGLDSLVKTTNEQVDVSGRLITIDSFSLEAEPNFGFPRLEAAVEVTTYLTPPNEGITAGATPAGPGSGTATPASTTLGGTP